MALAIVVGIALGVVSFLPLIAGRDAAKNATPTSNLGHTAALLLGVAGSFAILIIPAIVCIVNFRDVTIALVASEAGALIVTAIVYGIVRMVRK